MVLALALLLAGGAWVIRAPFVDKPVAPAPEVDLVRDLPAFRDGGVAVVAVNDAAVPRQALNASAAASSTIATKVDGAECGALDEPKYIETDVIIAGQSMRTTMQVAAAGTRFVAAQSRVDAALRASGDPFDRVVAELANVGDMRTAAGVAEAAAQQAASTSDARVYAVAYGACAAHREDAPSCQALTARRWAEIDAGNGLPWLEMLKEARERGDAAGQQEALSHLASASRFDSRRFAATGAVLRRMPPAETDFAAVEAMSMNLLTMSHFPSFGPLMDACRNQAGGHAAVARQCQAISDGMYEHGADLAMLSISANLQFQLNGDESRRDLANAERKRLSDSEEVIFRDEASTCAIARLMSQNMLRSGQIGELPAMRERARNAATVMAASAPVKR